MSRYQEFDRNLRGINRTIALFESAVESVRSMAAQADMDALTAKIAVLREIEAKWKKHDDFCACRTGARFSMPVTWDRDKAARYSATLEIEQILSRCDR